MTFFIDFLKQIFRLIFFTMNQSENELEKKENHNLLHI